MPFVDQFLEVKSCCGCIPDFTTASAIIAVLAIVTNPVLAWLMTRHTYAMRVSCYVSTLSRVDIVDLNINNIISFGFGVNPSVGNSCLTEDNKAVKRNLENTTNSEEPLAANSQESAVADAVKGLGWVVLVSDIILLFTSIVFLINIFQNPAHIFVLMFMTNIAIVVLLSTVYGVLYVAVCDMRGKGLALCELVLCFFDLALWAYFLMVVNGYRRIIALSTAGRVRARPN